MADEKQDDLSKTQKLPALNPAAALRAETRFKAEQQRIEKMIAAHAPLHEILSNLVLMIESQSPDMLCSILLISEDGDHVIHAVGPTLPESYMKAIDGLAIGPKHGSCGTAMWRGKPVVCTDIATDPLWEDYRQHALANDLAACWSTPIMSSKGKVLGTFAMYYRDKRGPTDLENHFTDVATRLAAKAIQGG
jgi:GAF domain-containing protein